MRLLENHQAGCNITPAVGKQFVQKTYDVSHVTLCLPEDAPLMKRT